MSDGFNSVVNSDGHVALKALCVCHSEYSIRSFTQIKSANEYQMPTGYKQLYITFNYFKAPEWRPYSWQSQRLVSRTLRPDGVLPT